MYTYCIIFTSRRLLGPFIRALVVGPDRANVPADPGSDLKA